VSQLIQQNEFSVTFCMSLFAINKLVGILRDDLEVHYHQALRSSKKNGPIQPELVVAMSLRWLEGGQWQDIKKVYGVSKGHFYFLRRKFMNAVVCCPTLEIWLPDSSDVEGLQRLALQFEATASSPVLRGCVGALDCLTVFVRAPTASGQRTYWHITQVITSMTVKMSRPFLITEASFYTLPLLRLGVFLIRMPLH
jgi:hypothetical protein